MTRVYFIRHCEAMGNVNRLFQGSTDCDISDLGKIQLNYLKQRFLNIQIDKVYSSPLIRAVKTAQVVAEPKSLPVICENGFFEIRGGAIEGKSFAKFFEEHPDLGRIWNEHPQDFVAEGGESMRQVYGRAFEAIQRIVKDNPEKNIAIATHGGVLRCLFSRFIYNDINCMSKVDWTLNTSVSVVEFEDENKWHVCCYNDASHVPQEYLPKRSRIGAGFSGEKK